MFKLTSLAVALAATFTFATAAEATLPASVLAARPTHLAVHARAPLPAAAAPALLYDQMDNATGDGAWSQNLEPMYDAYDNEAADDFVVSGDGWQVQQLVFPVAVVNLFGDPVLPQTVNVKVLGDLDNKPNDADVRCSYDQLPGQFDGDTDYALLSVDLPSACVLPAGKYWLSMQGNLNLDNEGLFYWTDRGVQSHAPAQWRNPGDGWESGCANWGDKVGCDQGEGVDLLFQVRGVAGLPAPAEPPLALPTLSQWALLLSGGLLGLFGVLGLRRRQRG